MSNTYKIRKMRRESQDATRSHRERRKAIERRAQVTFVRQMRAAEVTR